MKFSYSKAIALLILVFSVYSKLSSQGYTMYYMDAVPQSYYFNPATQPRCSFFLGLPGLSSTYFKIENSAFSFDNIIIKDPESDSVITIFHPNADVTDLLNQMKDVEQLSFDASLSAASFGFRAGNMFFAVDAVLRADSRIYFPKSLYDILLIGPGQNEIYNMSALGIDAQSFGEFGLTISKKFGNMLSIGIRPKYLAGIFTIQTNNNNILLETSASDWNLHVESEMMVAATAISYATDENGMFDPTGSYTIENPFERLSSIKNLNNGLGIDFGAHLNPTEQIQLSLSMLDLGYINWKYNTNIASINGDYRYTGMNLNAPDSIDFIESVFDSLSENLYITGVESPFTTYLNPKLIVGGRLFLTKGFDVGLLSKTVFYSQNTEQDFILLANLHPSRSFSLSASYSLTSKTHDIIGLGLGIKAGPFNWYLIADYLPTKRNDLTIEGVPIKIPTPVNLYNLSFRVGFNLMVGGRKQKKLSQDLPLFRSTDWVF